MNFQKEEYNRIAWEVWFKLQSLCGNFEGNDCGGRGLCSHKKNKGDTVQEDDHLRCSILNCHYGKLVGKRTEKIIADNKRERAKNANKPIVLEDYREPIKREAIDLRDFVSEDSLAYM